MDGAAAGCALFVGSFVRIFGGELLADSTTIFTATEKLLLELVPITVKVSQNVTE